MVQEYIEIRGARENNLKDVSLRLPKRKITIFTGVSGSGKSSVVFDTIANEAQRLLFENFSMFICSFLPRYPQPDVDAIENLSMAVIVDQKRLGGGSHSTVGTVTDIASVLRLLFSRIGKPYVRVNACVILRRNNFDHPFVLCFLPVTNLQSSLSRLFCHTADRCGSPPCGRSSPPGHAVVDGWRRDERTRDIPQSLPRSLVSSAKPTTAVQVVRPAAPTASTRSLQMPTEQASPPQTTTIRFFLTPVLLRQSEMTLTPTTLRQLTCDLLPLLPRTYVDNLDFLTDYFISQPVIPERLTTLVRERVQAEPGITIGM